MPNAHQDETKIEEMELIYERRYRKIVPGLFGFLRYEIVTKNSVFGKELRITNKGEPIEEVFVNGKEWVLLKTK